MTLLRLIGILAGGLFLIWSVAALRRDTARAGLTPLTIPTGFALVLVGAFPGLAGVGATLLELGRYPGSRLIVLLILVAAVFWMTLLVVLSRLRKLGLQLDATIRTYLLAKLDATGVPVPERCVLCVIPALDEAINLSAVIRAQPETINGRPVRCLVIDDGSTDATAGVAEQAGALVVRNPVTRGGGAALRVGFEAALRWNACCAVTLDADGQNDPGEIHRLVEPIVRGEADIVVGSRILGVHHRANWWRHAGVILFSKIFNVLMETKITDIASGYRAVRPDALRRLPLRQDQYHTAEFLVFSAKRGAQIVEVPITFYRRASGRSKKGPEVLYGLRFAYVLFRSWVRAI